MMNIFDFLSRDYILIQLIDASEAGKPAISPVAANVEHFFTEPMKAHVSTLDDNFRKQAVGLMVKTILAPFGYTVWKRKDLPQSTPAEKFRSASVYRFDPFVPCSMRVVKHIEEVPEQFKTGQ